MKRLAAVLLLSLPLLGDTPPSPGQTPIVPGIPQQRLELGYLGTTGNSDTQSFSGLYALKYRFNEKDELAFRTDAHYGRQDGRTSAERYRGHLLITHHVTPQWYYYGETAALRNTFDGFNQQYNIGAGAGYLLLNGTVHTLKLRAGLQYRYANLTTDQTEENRYAKANAEHLWRFNDKTKLHSELNALEDLETTQNYEILFRTALTTALVENFSLKIAFELKYDNTPVEGKKPTDTTTKIAIVYDF